MKNDKKPSLFDWLKENPSRTVNDYYSTFGVEIKDYEIVSVPNLNKKNYSKWIITTSLIALLSIFLALSFDFKTNKFDINNILTLKYKTEKKDIINLIEKAYLDLSNGTLIAGANSGNSVNYPFYNSDLDFVMSLLNAPYITSNGITIETYNYEFLSINDKFAKIRYVLTLKKKEGVFKTIPIDMV